MVGVVFGLQFVEFVAIFPHDDLGFGVDAADEVGIDDAGLAFGRGGSVGFASVLPRGGDLLFRAHRSPVLAGLETRVTKRKGSPRRGCPFDRIVAD
jgi:hypothetical protein